MRRAALGEVETLIAQRAIDVVIVNDFERLARTEERRYAALFHARRYSVEYRFASLGGDGRLGNTPMARVFGSAMQVFGEMERDKIFARTMRGRMRRAARGVPEAAGVAARRSASASLASHPTRSGSATSRKRRCCSGMFESLASGAEASARSMARILKARGIKTREGHDWTSATISAKLRNPLCCGRGRLLK